MAITLMEFKTGFTVKPSKIIPPSGQVVFTDGTNDLLPNQLQCEAYGYTYNRVSGTCNAFKNNSNLGVVQRNIDNFIKGSNNTTETGTNNTLIMGENNIVKGLSRNNIIIGSNNEIANSVNNAFVYGTKAQVTTDNTIILGGNSGDDELGKRQTMTLMYGVQTVNNSTIDSYLNNTDRTYFVVPTDTAIYFQSETIALRVAGDSLSGDIGDFKSWVERGVVINKSGTLSIERSRTSPADSGETTGWSPINSVSGTNFLQTVKGATDMIIDWTSTIRITQIKAEVAL
tara:strand:+ start:7703 stop:8560 length:858 start_codon:yes stop_codon:yes gene_type:complete